MNRLVANSGSTAMPIIPPSPMALTSAGLASCRTVPPTNALIGPGRCVNSIVPSGVHPMSHGLLSPLTTVVTARLAGGAQAAAPTKTTPTAATMPTNLRTDLAGRL